MLNETTPRKKKLILVISGKKQAGKNTFANQFVAYYLNHVRNGYNDMEHVFHGKPWRVNRDGKLQFKDQVVEIAPSHRGPLERVFGIEMLSFATPLKEFCVNVLGLHHKQVWGSDREKNTMTEMQWDNIPLSIRKRYGHRSPWCVGRKKPRVGNMTAREVMQVVGTDYFRAMFIDVWADACFRRAIEADASIVLIPDARFRNEVTRGIFFDQYYGDDSRDIAVYTVRLTRNVMFDSHPSEVDLDDFDHSLFEVVISGGVNMEEQNAIVEQLAEKWLSRLDLLVSPTSSVEVGRALSASLDPANTA